MNWDFFLAHARPDKAIAEELYEHLCPPARTFLDSRSLLLGDDWDRKLPRAQRDSRVTVVLISLKTDTAHYQRNEIAHAIAMAQTDETAHRVVPVYIDTDSCEQNLDVPYGLRNKLGLSFSSDGGIEGVAKRLLDLLNKLRREEADRAAVLSENDRDAVFILQQVPGGIPSSVVFGVTKIEERDVKRLAAVIIADTEVSGDCLILSDAYTAKVDRPNEGLLFARTLEGLIKYIEKHKKEVVGEKFLNAAFFLAGKCKEHDPRAARGLFDGRRSRPDVASVS